MPAAAAATPAATAVARTAGLLKNEGETISPWTLLSLGAAAGEEDEAAATDSRCWGRAANQVEQPSGDDEEMGNGNDDDDVVVRVQVDDARIIKRCRCLCCCCLASRLTGWRREMNLAVSIVLIRISKEERGEKSEGGGDRMVGDFSVVVALKFSTWRKEKYQNSRLNVFLLEESKVDNGENATSQGFYPLTLPARRDMEEDRPPSGSGGGIPPEKGGYEDNLNSSSNGASSSSSAAQQPQQNADAVDADNDQPQALFDLNSGAAVVFAAVMVLLHLFKGESCFFICSNRDPLFFASKEREIFCARASRPGFFAEDGRSLFRYLPRPTKTHSTDAFEPRCTC